LNEAKSHEDLIISVSGVRGTVGSALEPSQLTRFATAFGTLIKGGPVVVGRDTRTSGPMVHHAVFAGLIATGCQVIDVGVCPTPTVLLMSKALNAGGSLVITASHNPIDWNGIEFASESGRLLGEAERTRLMEVYESGDFELAAWDKQGSVKLVDTAVEQHIAGVLSCDWVLRDQTQSHGLKVVIDCGNGAGSVISPCLLRALGCEVVELNCVPDGYFPRPAEPTPDALDQLCDAVKSEGADLGLAHDGDADRLVLVSEQGAPLSSEYTFALAAEFLLNKRKGDIVATVSTSRMLDDVADRHGVQLHRTPVGVGYVVEKMRETAAVIGGEGTGGVIYPELQYTTDGIASIAAIIQFLAEAHPLTVSEVIGSIPSYAICKEKLEVPSQQVADAVLQLAIETYTDETLDLADGVKRVWEDRWVNIRKSGTEPVIRVFSEALTLEEAQKLCNSTLDTLKSLMQRVSY
jgi:phosphomannomutase